MMCTLCSVNTKICPPATLPNLTLRLDFSQRKPFRKWKWMHLSQSLAWIVLMGCHDKYWQLAEGSSIHCETPNERAADATTSSKRACGKGGVGGGCSGKAKAGWCWDNRACCFKVTSLRAVLSAINAANGEPGEGGWGAAGEVGPCNGRGFCILEGRGAAETSGGSHATTDVSVCVGRAGDGRAGGGHGQHRIGATEHRSQG